MSNWLRSPPGFVQSPVSKTVTMSSVNTKGSYVEMIASTPFDATGITVFIGGANTSTDRAGLYDIAVGAAASEVDIIQNISSSESNENWRFYHPGAYFPISIPAGSRISCRGQRGAGATTEILRVLLNTGGAWADDTFSVCHTMGSNTAASRGTAISATGGAGYGSYAQLTASSEFDCEALLISLDGGGTGAASASSGTLDIAVGAAASEVVLTSHQWQVHSTGEHLGPQHLYLPFHVPAGSRIAARMTCSVTETNYLTLHGFC